MLSMLAALTLMGTPWQKDFDCGAPWGWINFNVPTHTPDPSYTPRFDSWILATVDGCGMVNYRWHQLWPAEEYELRNLRQSPAVTVDVGGRWFVLSQW